VQLNEEMKINGHVYHITLEEEVHTRWHTICSCRCCDYILSNNSSSIESMLKESSEANNLEMKLFDEEMHALCVEDEPTIKSPENKEEETIRSSTTKEAGYVGSKMELCKDITCKTREI